MTERILITKLVRTPEGRADLYGRGHQYKDLTLFDLSDLVDAGIIEFESLPVGKEVPCRFWALYELSEKLNKRGNPYKDVIALEPVNRPATTTSVDNSSILQELRAIRILLEQLAGSPPPVTEPDREPPTTTKPGPKPPPPPPARNEDLTARARAYIVPAFGGRHAGRTLGDLVDDPTGQGFVHYYLANNWTPVSDEQKKLQAAARYLTGSNE